MAGLQPALLIVAILLFILSSWPTLPYSTALVRLGLAFFAGAHLV